MGRFLKDYWLIKEMIMVPAAKGIPVRILLLFCCMKVRILSGINKVKSDDHRSECGKK